MADWGEVNPKVEEFFHIGELCDDAGGLSQRPSVANQGKLNLDKPVRLKQFQVERRHELNIGQTRRRSRFRWHPGCADPVDV